MAKKKSPKKLVEPKTTPAYELILTVGGTIYSSSGETMEETLVNLPKPPKIFVKSSLLIKKGNDSLTRVLTIPQAKRLFFPMAQKVIAKQLATGL